MSERTWPVAGQIAWLQNALMSSIRQAMTEGGEPNAVSRTALVKLDPVEDLLSDVVLNFATKPTE